MISSEFSGLSGEASLPMARPAEPLPLVPCEAKTTQSLY
jgi:hypothetical protein